MSVEFERLKQAEERFLAFSKSAPIGLITSHLDGRVLDANDALLKMIGYTHEDLQAGLIRWDNLTPTDQLHIDVAAIEEAKKSGSSAAYEKEYITKSGSRIPVLIGFVLVGVNHEEALAFVVDLSSQKKAEAEIRRLNSELEERVAERTSELAAANRELEAFCYSVSHDLRAPLRSIDGFAFALLQDYEDKLDADGVEFIGRIRNSSKRMDELISALLSLSRLTTTPLERQQVDLSLMADAVVAEIRLHNPVRNIEFDIERDLVVSGDPRMLRAVLDNLLGNAAKFSGYKESSLISFGRKVPKGPFCIKDNGVGFDMAQSEKLFKPFERLHSPREFTGSGIGLATVQRIVHKHGGRIWAEAEVNEGATFYFTLDSSN